MFWKAIFKYDKNNCPTVLVKFIDLDNNVFYGVAYYSEFTSMLGSTEKYWIEPFFEKIYMNEDNSYCKAIAFCDI